VEGIPATTISGAYVALANNTTLLTAAVEEVLRYESVSYHFCRWVARDAEFHGATVPGF